VVHFSFVDCSIVSTVVIKQFVAVIVVSASPTATPCPEACVSFAVKIYETYLVKLMLLHFCILVFSCQ